MTDVALHSMHWKGYQSKLLVVHLKGDLCNFTAMTGDHNDELATVQGLKLIFFSDTHLVPKSFKVVAN